jgi:carbamoylphosphate synthase large subunit
MSDEKKPTVASLAVDVGDVRTLAKNLKTEMNKADALLRRRIDRVAENAIGAVQKVCHFDTVLPTLVGEERLKAALAQHATMLKVAQDADLAAFRQRLDAETTRNAELRQKTYDRLNERQIALVASFEHLQGEVFGGFEALRKELDILAERLDLVSEKVFAPTLRDRIAEGWWGLWHREGEME